MAITTLDALIAGFKPPEYVIKNGIATVVGVPYSPFYVGGKPGAAVAPSPGIAGAALTTYAGQIPVPPASLNTHLARFTAHCNVAGTLLLCDRLWHNSGISSTLITAQNINSVALPARDKNASINGADIMAMLEVSTIMGAGAGNATLSYTDELGNAGASAVLAYTAARPVGHCELFPLAAGDNGIRSIQTLTFSVSRTSGVIHLVLFRVLAVLPIVAGGIGAEADAVALGMPRMFDNTVPFLLFIPASTTAPVIQSHVGYSQG